MTELELIKNFGSISTAAFTVTEALKMAGIPSKYSPIVSILIGVGLSFLLGVSPVLGLAGGLSASGFYSGVKSGSTKQEESTPDYIPHID